MTPMEKEIEKGLVRLTKKYAGWCLKWVCPGWAGVPDRMVLLPGGRVIFVELKRPKGGVLSSRQKWWARKLQALGFKYWTIWDFSHLLQFEEWELQPKKDGYSSGPVILDEMEGAEKIEERCVFTWFPDFSAPSDLTAEVEKMIEQGWRPLKWHYETRTSDDYRCISFVFERERPR